MARATDLPSDLRPHLTVVVSGPSGAGKSTVCRRYVERHPTAELVVTVTTRRIRPGERDGVDYRFLSVEAFERAATDGLFLEHQCVHGNYYGSPLSEVRRVWAEGRDVILEIDVQGGLEVRRKVADAVLLFLVPSDLGLLRERLQGRGTDAPDTIERRLANARGEMSQMPLYDYVVFNDDLDRAVDQFSQIVEAERLRIRRYDIAALYGEAMVASPCETARAAEP